MKKTHLTVSFIDQGDHIIVENSKGNQMLEIIPMPPGNDEPKKNPFGPVFGAGRGFPWGIWYPPPDGEFVEEVRLSFPNDERDLTEDEKDEVLREVAGAGVRVVGKADVISQGDYLEVIDEEGVVVELSGAPEDDEEEWSPNPFGPIFQSSEARDGFWDTDEGPPDGYDWNGYAVAFYAGKRAPGGILIAKVFVDQNGELWFSSRDENSTNLAGYDDIPGVALSQGWPGDLEDPDMESAEEWFRDNQRVPFEDPGYF